MPQQGTKAPTIPDWLVEHMERFLETSGTRYQSLPEVIVAAYVFWRQNGAPDGPPIKRRGAWIPEVLQGIRTWAVVLDDYLAIPAVRDIVSTAGPRIIPESEMHLLAAALNAPVGPL